MQERHKRAFKDEIYKMFFRVIFAFLVAAVTLAPAAKAEPTKPAAARLSAPSLFASQKEAATTRQDARLARWIRGFRQRALASGVAAGTFDVAMRDVKYIKRAIELDRNQSEFTKTIWDYLDVAVAAKRVKNGKTALRKWHGTLSKIESRYQVDKAIVVAVWGLESSYGDFRGDFSVISALATLAYDGRRGPFFEDQLIAALKILQSGDTNAAHMTGSWAGAMGHTQFMPSSYRDYAVDFTGDGKRDIWSDNPTDALASTAAYLAHFGWIKGMPWGVEVRLPKNFNYSLAQRHIKKMPSDWAQKGVVSVTGKPIADYGRAAVLLPAGAQGAAFLVFQNFAVLESYNSADAYVIGVGHLADQVTGRPKIKTQWPRSDRALSFAERQEMQRRLTAAGFNTKGIDGKIGPLTIAAVRSFQRRAGLPSDGYASVQLLERLRR